jgi:alpha-glucosidase (family GH31 glycosyl hydrolase)
MIDVRAQCLAVIAVTLLPRVALADVSVLVRSSRHAHARVEVLDDGLLHFELSPTTTPAGAIVTTPMVARRGYPGPKRFVQHGANGFETAALRVRIDGALCLRVTDVSRRPAARLTTICPQEFDGVQNVLAVAAGVGQGLYGLGEHFDRPGEANGDLSGRVIAPGAAVGNAITDFNGGSTGNAQFPVLFVIGERSYALFVDQLEAQTWDLTGDPWRVTTAGTGVRGYVLAGVDPLVLRRRFMGLVGRPPVPPKKMFGLWVSEFGFDGWDEIADKLRTLRANHFPVDGFMLDLQWFGGFVFQRPSRIGSLSFDPTRFPDAATRIARLRDDEGIGLMTIEEPYVDDSRPEVPHLTSRGYLALACPGCAPAHFDTWWGVGGMLDWTNHAAGNYWHDAKRQPLVDAGVLGHWTDLGEPEDFSPDGVYHGFPQLGLRSERDVHNAYNLEWAASIARGYRRHRVGRRPFVLSRSGTAGIQRFGVAMWSGDIGSNLASLAAHLNVQMHMAFSGVDYFGADVGGFARNALDGDLNALYTTWLADAALLDVPVRPHTENLCNCKETAPDRVGDVASNRENVRLRYRLIPYLYSLAHRAHRFGDPVIPPLPLLYPRDPNVRGLADEKLVGGDLLVATVSAYGHARRDVYLPAGTWFDERSGVCVRSAGEVVRDVPTSVGGAFTLPLFARAGAIVPEMYVDDLTMNALGRRTDGSRRDELIVRVYADDGGGSHRFTLYEDDGETVSYLDDAVRRTRIVQRWRGDRLEVTVGASAGTYKDAPAVRETVLEVTTCGAEAASVVLDGAALERRPSGAAFDAGGPGWYAPGDGSVRVRTGTLPVGHAKRIVIRFASVPSP